MVLAFLFIASKNIFSDGYIQLPLALTPLSFSLFAGLESAESSTGEARGIVEITRWVPSPYSDEPAGVLASTAGDGAEENQREKSPGGAVGGD